MTTPSHTVAVLTASSNSGAACVSALLALPNPPPTRAIFRTEAKAAPFRAEHPSLDIHVGVDAASPPTLTAALAGCTVAFLVTPLSPAHGVHDDAQLVANMMHAAVHAGVSHIIYGASASANAPNRIPQLASRFIPGEHLLRDLERQHGVTWTVLRGGFFHDNYTDVLASVRVGDEVRFVEFCVPAVDPADIGRVAAVVAAAAGKGHEGKIYEISGPERLWMSEVVQIAGNVLQRELKFVDVGAEKSTEGMPPYLREAFQYMVEEGETAMPTSEDVLKVTGKPPVSFREWFEQRKGEFARK